MKPLLSSYPEPLHPVASLIEVPNSPFTAKLATSIAYVKQASEGSVKLGVQYCAVDFWANKNVTRKKI